MKAKLWMVVVVVMLVAPGLVQARGIRWAQLNSADVLDSLKISRTATVTVAASNSSALAIVQSDYQCDGTADEVQINAALIKAALTGGSVFLFGGTYTLTATVDLQSNVTLTGEKGATIVATNIIAYYVLEAAGKSNLTVENITIDADSLNYSSVFCNTCTDVTIKNVYFKSVGTTTGVGIYLAATDRATITECTFSFGFRGFYITVGSDIRISNNTFDEVRNCVTVATTTDRMIVSGNSMVFTGSVDPVNRLVDLADANYCVVSNNIMVNSRLSGGGDAIYSNSGGKCHSIIGNLIYGCPDVGIDIQSDHTLIAFNQVIDSGYSAIGLAGASYCNIIGNTVVNAKVNVAAYGYGITTGDRSGVSCTNNMIIGNMVTDNQDSSTTLYGFYDMNSGASDNTYIANFADSMGTANFSLQGTNLIATDNKNHITQNSGVVSVANGGKIAHGLADTASAYIAIPTVAFHMVAITAVDGDSMTVSLADSVGVAITTPENVSWWAEVR